MKYLHFSRNSMKTEKGISIKALNRAVRALYFFHLLEIHLPKPCTGRKNTSDKKLKKFSFSGSMVSSCALFERAVPANKITAINIISMIIDSMWNPKWFKTQYIAPNVTKADKTYMSDKIIFPQVQWIGHNRGLADVWKGRDSLRIRNNRTDRVRRP